MRFRKLRIIWSVFCGVACLLLIVLWASSYFYVGRVFNVHANGQETVLMSESRCLIVMNYPPALGTPQSSLQLWGCRQTSASTLQLLQPFNASTGQYVPRSESPFTWLPGSNTFYGSLPHWSVVICFGVIGLIPWLRWSTRFSLRTLIIATTLVAVVLGLIVYVARQ